MLVEENVAALNLRPSLTMVLFQRLVLISFSIFPMLSQRLIVDPRQNDRSVVIKGLAPPQSTLTLEEGSTLRILKSDDVNGESDFWKIYRVEVPPQMTDQHRAQMVFEKVDFVSSWWDNKEFWTDQQLADQILAKHVYITKLSVSASASTNDPEQQTFTIRGLTGSQSQIELNSGSSLKINGNEGSINSIKEDIIKFNDDPYYSLSTTKNKLFTQILFGQVQYKSGEQWHQLQSQYELINPSPMALQMKQRDDSSINPRNGFPKPHEIIHCMCSMNGPFFRNSL